MASVLLFCGLVLGYGASAQAQSVIISIDVPGAGTSQGQGTGAAAIDASGAVTIRALDARIGPIQQVVVAGAMLSYGILTGQSSSLTARSTRPDQAQAPILLLSMPMVQLSDAIGLLIKAQPAQVFCVEQTEHSLPSMRRAQTTTPLPVPSESTR